MSMVRLILASQSPRRAQLLSDAGYRFEQASPPFVDPPTPMGKAGARGAVASDRIAVEAAIDEACAHACDLALRKARSLTQALPDDGTVKQRVVILGADTILVGPDGVLLGQPQARDEAAFILRSLIGGQHHAVTGVAVVDARDPSRDEVFADVAAVTLGALPAEERERYLDSGDWRGKAGGYNLGEVEAIWPMVVEGDRTTVIGLPMLKLNAVLSGWGVTPGHG